MGKGRRYPITLQEALSGAPHTPLRLHAVASLNGKLRSVEAVYGVRYGRKQLSAGVHEYKAALLQEARMDASERRPVQAMQRLWSLAAVTKDHTLRQQLETLLSSDA